jgi:hypothetical protein
MGLRVSRILGHGLLEALVGADERDWRVLEHVMPSLEHRLIRGQLRRVSRLRRLGGEPDLQRARDSLRDLVLNREDVRHLAIVPLGPDVAAVGRRDELCGDPDSVARLADAAFEHVGDAQHFGDLPDVIVLALECERRRPCDHLQGRGTWVRALMISSARPSLKYSFSGSALMFVKARTAIDARGSSGPSIGSRAVFSSAILTSAIV